MKLNHLPQTLQDVDMRTWESFAPYFDELRERPLTAVTLPQWLSDWSHMAALVYEAYSQAYIDKAMDTSDEEKEAIFLDLVNNVIPHLQIVEQALKEKLLAVDTSGMPELALMIRNMRNEVDLFREENVPLDTELAKLGNEYEKITGALETEWDGETKNLNQLAMLLQKKDRNVRERAWRTMMDLWLSERETLNALYGQMLSLRRQMAANAGLTDYREYAFRQYARFDYTPEDCLTFHEAIEQVVAPAAARIYEKKRQQLGIDVLQPWDTKVDTSSAPPLKPYQGQAQLIQHSLNIFHRVNPELGQYFATMAEEDLLDLETRSGKALGGFCSALPLRKRPFIFMNGVGIHDDVQTLLHEAGHAFHAFESFKLPYIWQADTPMEFNEVASMAMELLSAPYLTRDQGGFYTTAEAARARIEHLEGVITFLPYMAVVDAFQHWVYTHPDAAQDPTACDQTWDQLWQRFMKGVNWTGLDTIRQTGWHRKLHIFVVPFYYIEYGMAQVGALQVWRNSLSSQETALSSYRRALALGGTQPLPTLYSTAGAEFRFDVPMLTQLVELVEATIEELETMQ